MGVFAQRKCYAISRKDFCPSPFYMASALIISIRVWTIFKISVARTTFSRSTFLLRFFFFRAIFCASSFCYSIYLSVVYWYNKDREKAACEQVRGKGSLYGYSLQIGYFGSLEKQGVFNVQIAKRETPFRRSDSISAQSKNDISGKRGTALLSAGLPAGGLTGICQG